MEQTGKQWLAINRGGEQLVEGRRLDSLQALRGIAAMLVVLMHTMNLAAVYSGAIWAQTASRAFVYTGHWGVDIFFVLSGFVIAGLVARSESGGRFFLKRAARVYPLFWLSLAAILSMPAMPGVDNSVQTVLDKPLAVLLLQTPAAHPVAWTLVYEVQFYLVAAALILSGAGMRRAFVAWVVMELVLVTASGYGLVPRFPLTDALTLEFCMGVAIALFGSKVTMPATFATGISLALVIAAGFIWDPHWISVTTPVRTLLWGLPAAILVLAALSAERQSVRFPRWLTFLGDVSYSIYMWHLVVLVAVAAAVGPWLSGNVGAGIFIVIALPLALVVSIVSFYLVERPVMRLASHATSRRKEAIAA